LLLQFVFAILLPSFSSLSDGFVLQEFIEIDRFEGCFPGTDALDIEGFHSVDRHCFVGLLLTVTACLWLLWLITSLLWLSPLLPAHDKYYSFRHAILSFLISNRNGQMDRYIKIRVRAVAAGPPLPR
jgi:hypothetical protein